MYPAPHMTYNLSALATEEAEASQAGDGKTNWNSLIYQKQDLWKEELGFDCKKSPQELREILGWNKKSNISTTFFLARAKDLIIGSNKSISLEVFKSGIKNR